VNNSSFIKKANLLINGFSILFSKNYSLNTKNIDRFLKECDIDIKPIIKKILEL
jgi:hypothetical protein